MHDTYQQLETLVTSVKYNRNMICSALIRERHLVQRLESTFVIEDSCVERPAPAHICQYNYKR
jgi:hypothetical protein